MKAGVLLFAVLVLQCCVFHALSQGVRGKGNQGRGRSRGKGSGMLRGNSPFVPRGGRGRQGGLFNDLQQRLRQRFARLGDGSQRIDPSQFKASASFWNRTLEGGAQVLERGVFQNTSIISVVRVVSRDRGLTSAGYTGAATLYVFGEQGTTVILKPGFFARRRVPACFLLPDRNITFSEAVDEVISRNHTDIPGAPATVEKLNGTAEPLDMMERLKMYGQHPAILVFCGVSNLVKVVPVDDAITFPTASGTETEQVLRVITLDRELQILAPRDDSLRLLDNVGPAWRPGRPFLPRPTRRSSAV